MNGPNWDKDIQEDRTCTDHSCEDFGTHRVITRVAGEFDQVDEWMCPDHSLDAVVNARCFGRFGETVTRMVVAR